MTAGMQDNVSPLSPTPRVSLSLSLSLRVCRAPTFSESLGVGDNDTASQPAQPATSAPKRSLVDSRKKRILPCINADHYSAANGRENVCIHYVVRLSKGPAGVLLTPIRCRYCGEEMCAQIWVSGHALIRHHGAISPAMVL